jgi:hypothetical protein
MNCQWQMLLLIHQVWLGGSEIDSRGRQTLKQAILDVPKDSPIVRIGGTPVPFFVPLMASLQQQSPGEQ